MPSEHKRPSMFAPGHRQSDISPPNEQPPSQEVASQQCRTVRNPHYERWYREHHRRQAYEALTQNQIKQTIPTSALPTTSRNAQAIEQIRRPPAANPHLLQQAQSPKKARRSSQIIDGVLGAGSVASSAKSPLQNDLMEDDGGTPQKSGPHLSIIPPTPPEEDTAPANVPPRQNTDSLTILIPNMSQPRNYPPEANTQRSTRREKERHLPLLTPGVVPSQVEVRKVSVDHQGTRSSQQAQHHDTQRPLPVPPVELTPQPRNSQPETNTQHSTRREKERHPRSLTPGVAPSQAEVRNVPIDHRGDRPPQLGQHHDAQRPLPAPPAEPVVRNEPVDHRGARTSQQDQRHVTQRPLPAPPVEPTVTLPPFVATGPNIGGISRLSYFLWYGGGRPGGVQSVISHGARPADNRTVGQYIRRPALDPLGASVSSVEGLFELEAGVDPMAALGAAVAAFREEERNYLGDSLVRDEGPPVLPRLLVGDGSVDLDFASPAANELPAGKSDEQPAAEVETSAPIYELFARERDWDFDMDVVEQYKKGCGTNH